MRCITASAVCRVILFALVAGSWLSGCESHVPSPRPSASPLPIAPTPVTQSPPPLPPERHQGALTGVYTMTITAAPECVNLPVHARVRAYGARVYYSTERQFVGVLDGADFQPGYGMFHGLVGPQGEWLYLASHMAEYSWGEYQPIIEYLSGEDTVLIRGQVTLPTPMSAALTFEGTVSYCAKYLSGGQPLWPSTCAAPIACDSDRHVLRLERR